LCVTGGKMHMPQNNSANLSVKPLKRIYSLQLASFSTMRYIAFIAVFCIASVFLLSLYCQAGVPNEVNYQGRLNEYNQPVTGSRKICFVIYDASAGGNQVWTSNDVTVQVTGGIFTQILNPNFDFRGKDYYLELWISDKKLTPREKLTSN